MNQLSSESAIREGEYAAIWQTPEYFPLRLVAQENKLVLVPVSEKLYREVNFLDDREIPTDGILELPLDRLIRMSELIQLPRKPLHAIYHIAFCGSTLISRCLDQLSDTLVLKEPLPFHDVAYWKRHGMPGAHEDGLWKKSFELLMSLLSRTFRSDQTVIIKPTDASTNLIGDVMAYTQGSRAIFLYVGLEEFLLSVLHDDIRMGFVRDRLEDLAVLFPDNPFCQDDCRRKLAGAEQAACLWYFHTSQYRKFVTTNPGADCRSLNLGEFLHNPVNVLSSLVRFLGVNASGREIEDAIAARMGVHSKDLGVSYTAEDRAGKQRELSGRYREEIRLGLVWAERRFAYASRPEVLPRPLEIG